MATANVAATTIATDAATIPPKAPASIARFVETPLAECAHPHSQAQSESTFAVICRLPSPRSAQLRAIPL
jgi:hypothetical protein